ncbi:hypothetical protein HCN44_000727 [Aphidius gifuensis]|uniref:G domain-containing protein n=1 Tax=Aphidius gifuensis TaxID=684658 RepID=A0A834XSP0_APHGI|nr:hypothetical protein HCN44_000727 [Aphidius gifuensis]
MMLNDLVPDDTWYRAKIVTHPSIDVESTNINNKNRNTRDTPCTPGKTPSTHSTNNEKKNHTVSSIMDSLNQGTANIKYSNDPKIILLLGLSGAGKSTLAQYLFGNNSNLMAVAKKNFKCKATGDFYIEDTGKKIGHNTLLSHTELPDLVIDPETNTTIYDCPGFSDTRDPEHDISGAYFIKAVSDKAKALKFIFVVNYNSITIGANRADFIILARHATNLIHNISKYNESIALVATKIKDDKPDDQRIIAIADYLQEVRDTLKESNELPNVQSFIDIILTTSGPDNQDYTKIGLMPKFNTAGRLNDSLVVQAYKKSLLTLIHNNINFTEINTTDLKPTISSDSVYYIDGLVNEVTQQMWIYINNVVQKVQVFYNDLIQNMLDTIHTLNDEKIMIDTDQSKAELFLTKLNKGLSAISEVVRNIQRKTTLNELSKYIISSALISEVNLSQDLIVSNISTQHEYLNFLLTVHEPRHSFNVDAVITLFTNLENELKISINHFHSNVSDITNQIENTISSIDNNVMNEIQKNFSSITETILNNTKISLLLNSGRSELLEIRNLANGPDITYKCINQIQRTVNHFNFSHTNIQSVDLILQNTSRLINKLHFLQNLTDEFTNSNSMKCTDNINRVISYLDDLGKCYSCELKSPDHLVIKGHYIKLSDLNNCPQTKNATLVEIFALKKIFIDTDIDKTGENFSLCIIAPIWEIHGSYKIKLDGKPGDTQRKAVGGHSKSIPHGKDGAPGLPGGPGGSFLGIGATFIDSNYLSISADGGNGGPGQDAGDGMHGQDDTECPSSIENENYPSKEHCLSFNWWRLRHLYDDGCTARSTFDGFSLDIRVNNSYHQFNDTSRQVVTCHPKNDGLFKGNGTNGGNGGKGGMGGHPGNVTVIAKVKQSISLSNRVGKTGSDGNGGVGGEAGKKGKNLVIDMIRVLYRSFVVNVRGIFLILPNEHKLVVSEEFYFPGKSGTNGHNTENIKKPEKAVSPLKLAHQSLHDYKTFFNQYPSDNTEDVDSINFLDILEKL